MRLVTDLSVGSTMIYIKHIQICFFFFYVRLVVYITIVSCSSPPFFFVQLRKVNDYVVIFGSKSYAKTHIIVESTSGWYHNSVVMTIEWNRMWIPIYYRVVRCVRHGIRRYFTLELTITVHDTNRTLSAGQKCEIIMEIFFYATVKIWKNK